MLKLGDAAQVLTRRIGMFYERYVFLCEGRGLTPSAGATKAGFNRGTVSVWKKKYEAKQDVVPEQNIIDKICAFFGCSESWLRGIEKAPTQDGERKIDDRKIKAAFLGGLADGLSDAEINEYWDDARDYIGFKIQQKKNKSD